MGNGRKLYWTCDEVVCQDVPYTMQNGNMRRLLILLVAALLALAVPAAAQPAPYTINVVLSLTGPAGASSAATLTITIPATKHAATFSYWDTHAGSPGITAVGPLGRIANIATIVPGPVSSLSIPPGSLASAVGAAHAVTVIGDDKRGNAVVARLSPTWTVTRSHAATLSVDRRDGSP